jgi:hypothetical protein
MSKSFAVLKQFCYGLPGKFKRLTESSHFSAVRRVASAQSAQGVTDP